MLSKKDLGKMLADIDQDQLLEDYGGTLKLPSKVWPAVPTFPADYSGELPKNPPETDIDFFLFQPDTNGATDYVRLGNDLKDPNPKPNEQPEEELEVSYQEEKDDDKPNEVAPSKPVRRQASAEGFEEPDSQKMLPDRNHGGVELDVKSLAVDVKGLRKEDPEEDIFSDRADRRKLKVPTALPNGDKLEFDRGQSNHQNDITDTIEDNMYHAENALPAYERSPDHQRQRKPAKCCCRLI